MQRSRLGILAVLTIVGMLAGPLLPASGDTFGAVAFVDHKATVQCPPDGLGRTGIGSPGQGINKNKNCTWSLLAGNAHKTTATCVGIGVADALKKGNKKAPVDGPACTVSASGTLGPVIQWPGPNVKVPAALAAICTALGKPLNGTGGCDITKNQRFGGPWCGLSKGQSGNGTITVGTKAITISNIRWQSQGTVLLVTATASKPGVSKPGQAGPALVVAHARPDEHKVLGGVPNSSCLTGSKNFKVDGIGVAALIGTK